jgi:hypothetical protein
MLKTNYNCKLQPKQNILVYFLTCAVATLAYLFTAIYSTHKMTDIDPSGQCCKQITTVNYNQSKILLPFYIHTRQGFDFNMAKNTLAY